MGFEKLDSLSRSEIIEFFIEAFEASIVF